MSAFSENWRKSLELESIKLTARAIFGKRDSFKVSEEEAEEIYTQLRKLKELDLFTEDQERKVYENVLFFGF
ncbi:hypothetical protein [Sediminitomix flava]|uniref:Uncharacterized protein n=1 Tax=Sediminitomix flava TaxID=379075 RepID=A0A315ZGW5_SEDFL|nr:hypothetical protein [Sediminitomix flava]PWJ44845.1 hypothetical protein BC781_1011224 [Sediminitomix flava]